MRNQFFCFCSCCRTVIGGCDLLNQEVLIDENVKTTVTDSTTIRLMNSVPDSTQLIINTEALWHASVSKGGEWCKLSKYDGRKGRDTLCIRSVNIRLTVTGCRFILPVANALMVISMCLCR